MKKRVWIAVLALVLFIPFSEVRFYTIDDKAVLLYKSPFEHGSSTARADIDLEFENRGKNAEQIKSVSYIGSGNGGVYYRCVYTEADGSESIFYAFDDSSMRSTARAKVFW